MEMNALQHHGIKGQKWGVRRYQNADGSLTSDGKKRYGSGDSSTSKNSEADAQKKERTKKIIAGVAVAATLTAATAVYLKNKDTVDKFVKDHGSDLIGKVKDVKIVEYSYYGDFIRNTRQLQSSDSLNDDINVANEISIVADPFARANFYRMRYVTYMGVKWKISKVEVGYPRLILTIGGVYNGKET